MTIPTWLFVAVLATALSLGGCGADKGGEVHAEAASAGTNPYPPGSETPLLWSAERWKQQEKK